MQKTKRGGGKALAVIVLIAAAVVYTSGNKEETASAFAETGMSLELNYDDKADVHSYAGRGFFLTTKDGMKFYTSDGAVKWTEIYPVSMKDPLMAGEGPYAGICDANGSAFYLFSADGGLCYAKNYDEKVLSFSVSAGGYASVICKNGKDYIIQGFNPVGDEISGYHSLNANTYPLASDISSDGRMLAISFIDINSPVITSKLIIVSNDSDAAQTRKPGVIHQETREGEFIFKLLFLQNELLFLSDKVLSCLSAGTGGDTPPEIKWDIALYNEVDSIAAGSGNTFAVAYGKPMPGEDSKTAGTVEVYSNGGNLLSEYELPGKVSLYAYGGFIVAGGGKKFAGFNARGKQIWEYNAVSDVKKLAVLENQNTVLILDNLRAQVIKKR